LWWLLIGRHSVERRRRLAASLNVEIVEPYFLKKEVVDERFSAD
jgi:hypothetical protein